MLSVHCYQCLWYGTNHWIIRNCFPALSTQLSSQYPNWILIAIDNSWITKFSNTNTHYKRCLSTFVCRSTHCRTLSRTRCEYTHITIVLTWLYLHYCLSNKNINYSPFLYHHIENMKLPLSPFPMRLESHIDDMEDIDLVDNGTGPWEHKLFDWEEHARQLDHEDRFENEYRMSLGCFTNLCYPVHPTPKT